MSKALLVIVLVLLIALGAGFVFLATWDIPAPTARIEKVIPNDRFAN